MPQKNLLLAAQKFVAANVKPRFHDQRLTSLERLKLQDILKRKNPYLFRAKAVVAAPDMVKQLLDAHLSSNEETLFGRFLEELAIEVSRIVFDGDKSSSEGIDMEFKREGKRYAVSIKSGPNWGNSRQIKKMVDDFNRVKRIAKQGKVDVECVNGCCYGKDSSPHKKDGYLKLCGQDFWALISGDESLYQTLIEPLGFDARKRNDEFHEAYGKAQTRFTTEFAADFCTKDGGIDWAKLLKFNSGSATPWQV
jgi:hypothetical protein